MCVIHTHMHTNTQMTVYNDQRFVLIKSLLFHFCPCLHVYMPTNTFELIYIHQYICAKEKSFVTLHMLPVLGERSQWQPLACDLEKEALDAKSSLSRVVSCHV